MSAEDAGDSIAARDHYDRLLALVAEGVENTLGHDPSLQRYLFSARISTGQASGSDLREAAFRDYLQASTAFTGGDTVSARRVARTATVAFAVEGAELGGHDPFHIAELLYIVERYDSALTTLGPLLSESPEAVLSLGLAGASAEAAEDSASAAGYYGRMLDLLETGSQPVAGHIHVFERVRASARRFTGRAQTPDHGG